MNEASRLVERSIQMIVAGYFLARCGRRKTKGSTAPPSALNVDTWNAAYNFFYDTMGDGRTPMQFRNSIKNVRDTFDVLFDNNRIGWIDKDGKQHGLNNKFKEIHSQWKGRPDEELETYVFGIISRQYTTGVYGQVDKITRTEGGRKVFVSVKYERDPKLRKEALAIHGYSCMSCGFNFEEFYGKIGEKFIEVHHTVPLSEAGKRETDPSIDLVVLCSNCHRMVHRRKGICLSLEEIRRYIK